MKKAYILFSVLLSTAFMTNAQNTVVADASAEYLGYANVFETIANGGAFVFGSGWGVADLKSVVDAGAGSVTIQPNFNTYADNPGDPFWIDAATGLKVVNVSVVSAKMMHKKEGKKFWKTVASVAGNQRKGKGTTYDEAINNAIRLCAQSVAKQMVQKVNAKGIK